MGPAGGVREPAVVHGGAAVRVMVGLAVVSAGALLLAVVWAGRRDNAPADDPGEPVRVGVVAGQSVGGYLGNSQAELATLTAPSAPASGVGWALVSLDAYVPPAKLPGLLAGAPVAQVYARAHLVSARSPVVRIPVYRLPADVLSGMADAAVQRDREEAEYRRLSQRLRDDWHQERARLAYEAAAEAAAAEADAYRSGCSCIFAAVVRAAPATLREVAQRPGVRAVDPAPEVRRLDRAEFRPPLPEQDGTDLAEPSGSPTRDRQHNP